MNPHVHYSWKQGDRSGSAVTTGGYTMELTTAEIVDGKIAGTLSLVVTGENPVNLKGNFTAQIE